MARIGFAVAVVLGLLGLVLMVLGADSAPTAQDSMMFIAGAVLLGSAAICLSIAGATMAGRSPAYAEQQGAAYPRAEPELRRYPDPFTAGAAIATPGAAAASADILTGDPDEVVHPVAPPAPAPFAPEQASSPELDDPIFELPPLRPRPQFDVEPAQLDEPDVGMKEQPEEADPVPPLPEPAMPAMRPLVIESVDVVPEVEAPPATRPAVEEAATEDSFDLEAAIAAELGVSSFPGKEGASAPAVASAEPDPDMPDVSVADTQAEPAAVQDEMPQEHAQTGPGGEPAETDEAHAAAPEPDPAAAEDGVYPERNPDDGTPDPAVEKIVVGSYESGGVTYTLFEDGSVTAEAGGITETYPSLDALRAAFDRTPA